VGDHIRNWRFHLYADDLQIFALDRGGDLNQLVALINDSQVLLNSRMIMSEEVSSDVILGGDSVQLSDVLKNLGLYVDARFS
jgi:hypothetical protein